MRRGFGLFWLLLTVVIAGIVGAVAFQAGMGEHIVTSGPAPGAYPPDYYYYPHGGWGFLGIFPLLFFILILFLVFGRRRHHWYGMSGHQGHWQGGQDVPPFVEPMLQKWHAKAHGEQAAGPGKESPPS